jgi:hypothetical protein
MPQAGDFSMRMLRKRLVELRMAAAMIALAAATCRVDAAVLYDENFAGPAATVLNGQIPDTDQNGGFNQWRAHTGFLADGSMTAPAGGSGAWLAFVPTPGFTYTLSASFIGVTGNTNWMGIGFAESVPANPQATGNDVRFISGATVGKAWMLFRGQSTSTTTKNQSLRGDANSGTFAANAVDWLGPEIYAGDIDMRIVLDTTGGVGNYNATFFAKRPTDGVYTQVSASNLPLAATDIGSVGFAASGAANLIDSTITNFTLETTGPIIQPGDVDGNGSAGPEDFFIIRDNLFDAVTGRSMGDLNSDNFVDFTDFRLWKNAAPPAVSAGLTIPEPAALCLAGMAIAGAASLRSGRRASTRRRHS